MRSKRDTKLDRFRNRLPAKVHRNSIIGMLGTRELDAV